MEKPDRVKTSLSISKELHKQIKILAVIEGKGASELYEEALRELIFKRKFRVQPEAEDYPE